MSNELKKIVENLSKLSVMEAAELAKMLEEEWGVSAAAPVAMAMPAAAAAPVEAAAEKTEFNVELTEIGAEKLKVIKVVRELTGLGLTDAKSAVEAAPKVIKEGVNKETADDMKKKLEEVGAKITLK